MVQFSNIKILEFDFKLEIKNFGYNAPVVQRIGHKIADLVIEVRFLVGALYAIYL